MKTYLLIDSHALIHRAYHAMPFLQNKNGVPSGALFGLTNMILSAIEKFKPDYIFAANDLPKATFREMAFKDYKSHRSQTEDKLVEQIELMPKIFEAFKIPLISKQGYEADDVIGTFVKKLLALYSPPLQGGVRGGLKIYILTGDMDIMQLVEGDKVNVYTGKKGEEEIVFNEEQVFKKYGLKPKQIPDYKGLRGDTSDNIPGIKGIGEKTALTIIQKGESLKRVYDLLNGGKDEEGQTVDNKYFGISERFFELLKQGEDEAEFSKELATINCDLDTEIPQTDKFNLENCVEDLKNICEEYGFASIKKKLDRVKSLQGEVVLNDFVEVSTATPSDEGESKVPQVQANIEFSPEIFRKLQVAIWLLNSVETNIDKERVNYLIGQYKIESKNEVDILEFFEKKLKDENLWEIYNEVELPLFSVLDEANKIGIKLDREKLKKLLNRYEIERGKLQEKIFELAGESFNLNSPKQLGVILFEKLKVQDKIGIDTGKQSKIKKTTGGKLSTRAEVLEEMKDNHEIIKYILDFREKEKMINTYLEPLLVYSQFDERIHTTFIQTGAQTGRFSSVNPNMQNIPVRGPEGQELRECFVADKGKVLIAADYSQIELRIAAMLADEKYLQEVFKSGGDIHKSVATKMFKKTEDEITKDERNAAKAMNFGILYGMGVNSIRNTLKVERNVAQAFYDSYTLVLPNLMKYLKDTISAAKDIGYTETLYGRRRKIPELFSNIPMIRASGERFAMNAPIQGTSADIIKLAMSDFKNACNLRGWKENQVAFILQIHDEIIYEVDEKIQDEVGAELKKVMENVLVAHKAKNKYLEVPIEANVKVGKNWGQT